MHQLLGLFVVIVSIGVFLDRYGVPTFGLALVYLLFGGLFVVIGVVLGQMYELSVWELLILKQWGINLSLLAIGYSAVVSGLVGIGSAVLPIVKKIP